MVDHRRQVWSSALLRRCPDKSCYFFRCRDHPFVDYILFLPEPTGLLKIKLRPQLHYLEHLCKLCGLEITDSGALYCKSKVSFITQRVGPDENSHTEVPGEWKPFVKKGCPVEKFEGTSESAQGIMLKIVNC